VEDFQNTVQNFIIVFTSIFYEAIPYIAAGAVIAGVVEELIPQRMLLRFIPRNRFLAIAVGGLLGLPSPMCDCAILVVVRRLLRKGVPLSSCVCLLLAGPIVNFLVMLSTWDAFRRPPDDTGPGSNQIGGLGMMSLRIGIGYLIAFGTSLVVEWQYRKHGAAKLLHPIAVPPEKPELVDGEEQEPEAPRPFMQRLNSITEIALHDFVDVAVFVIFGALLAAAARQVIVRNPGLIDYAMLHPTASIVIMMGLAVLLCICSQADAFIAASFTQLPPASKLAFLTLGPMLDLKLYMMYTRVFRYRLICTIISAVVIQVLLYSLLVHFIWLSYVASRGGTLSP
jgi:uncharacterized membrane protein YraQ (UPF0718 family)